MASMTPQQAETVLTDDMLARFAARAPQYDRDNVFFSEDFDELRQAGYLRLAIPRELGGGGLSLAGVARQQRRLGYHAAPTALAINMHLYWTGIAADLWRAGDHVAALAARSGRGRARCSPPGHAESGNDIPVLLSTTKAERVEGGYRFTGRKSFGSLSPVWTYLGIHGMDTADPANPKIVHAFMPRDTEGYRIEQDLGCARHARDSSDDTILEGVFVPDRYVVRVVPAGAAGIDAFVLGLFAWALLGFGNIYYGLAHRALDLTVEAVKIEAVDRADAADGLSRGGAASRRGDGAGLRVDRAASRSHRRGLVARASITARRGRPRSSRRSTTPSKARGASSISRSKWRAGSGSSARAGSSRCSAMRASAASTRRTRC